MCAALLAASIAFNLVLLSPELAPVPPLNDGALHYPLITGALNALQNGESIWDHWNSGWVPGFPVFHYYQHLPHIVVAGLQRLSGVDALTLFNALRYLLLAVFPAVFFVAARTLGLTRTAATFAGMAASLISAPTLAGFEMESYVWGGTGMYTQIWGMTLLPLAVAHLFRFARLGRGLAAAVALTAGLVVSHTFYAHNRGLVLAGSRQQYPKRSPASRSRLDLQFAIVHLDGAIDHREADSGPSILGCEIQIEDLFEILRLDPDSGVLDA